MKVFVTGGTGAIGSHVVPALVEAGHAVTALARSPEKAATLAAQGVEPVIASLFDREALAAAFADHDAVVNLATALPATADFLRQSAWSKSDRVRIEGSAAVVHAARTAGVGRLVQESVCMIYPDRGADWIDEDVPTDHYPMARANHVAESNARRFADGGGIGVVLRLGWFYGPGAAHSEEIFALARRHLCVAIGRPNSYLSSIHMEDAGTAVVASLDAPGGTFNVVNDEPLTTRAFADALAVAAGARPWLRLPGRAALLLGDRSTPLTRSLRVSNRRFRETTGWAPRYPSAREGWEAAAQVLGER